MRRFGTTGFGGTRYRVVWSEDRMETRFGEEKHRYGDGLNRWLVEKFLPWEEYGEWDDACFGPKPAGGEYDLAYTLEVEGQFVDLDTFGADTLELMIHCIERSKLLSQGERVRARQEEFRKREAEWKQRFSDIYDDAQRPFGENAVAGIPDKKKPEDIVVVTPEQLPKHIRKNLAVRPGQIKQIT